MYRIAHDRTSKLLYLARIRHKSDDKNDQIFLSWIQLLFLSAQHKSNDKNDKIFLSWIQLLFLSTQYLDKAEVLSLKVKSYQYLP